MEKKSTHISNYTKCKPQKSLTITSPSIYRYVLVYIVDNTGRHDIDFGREGLSDDSSFFSL